jgi:hypothetical protein
MHEIYSRPFAQLRGSFQPLRSSEGTARIANATAKLAALAL